MSVSASAFVLFFLLWLSFLLCPQLLRKLWKIRGQEKSSLTCTDALIRSLSLFVLPSSCRIAKSEPICTVAGLCRPENTERCQTLYVWLLSLYVCVRPLYKMKPSETEADKEDQWWGLETTDKGACHQFFNEQLDPISRGQQLLSKSPSCSPRLWSTPCYRICLSVSRIPKTSLSQNPIWQRMAHGPSDTCSNMAIWIMLSPQREGGQHVISWSHTQSCMIFFRLFIHFLLCVGFHF